VAFRIRSIFITTQPPLLRTPATWFTGNTEVMPEPRAPHGSADSAAFSNLIKEEIAIYSQDCLTCPGTDPDWSP
jgi:hypothetical protein